jgi:8-oxo-dGTP pyrophosphatase MutT (NUDIX family)
VTVPTRILFYVFEKKMSLTPRVVGTQECRPEGFRWLTLKRLEWQDPTGRRRFWESVERTTRAGEVDAVAIVARVFSSSFPPRVIILSQYRPPINSLCLELPAGLIDAGESPGEAALRELAEETGFRGSLASMSPICCSDPGMTNANMQLAVVDIDADAPDNINARPQPHDGEFIEVRMAPCDGLLEWLMAEQARTKCQVDARLLSLALGLGLRLDAASPLVPPPKAVVVPPLSFTAADDRDAPLPFGSPLASPGHSDAEASSRQQQGDSVATGPYAVSGDGSRVSERRPSPSKRDDQGGGGGGFGGYLLGVVTAVAVSFVAGAIKRGA